MNLNQVAYPAPSLMKKTMIAFALLGASPLAIAAVAQRTPGDGPGAALTKLADVDDLVTRLLAFDKKRDDKLAKIEITDRRLHHLFDRADADNDGLVTKDELSAFAAREHSDVPDFGGGPGGPGGLAWGDRASFSLG